VVSLNSKGQSFSTFQLLISAVVALAILGLLISIIFNIGPIGTPIPSEATSNLLKNQQASPSALITSGRITFKEVDTLNTKALATSSGWLSPAQICLSKGDYPSPESFTFTDADGTIMKTTQSQTGVKISVICDVGTELEDDLQRNGITGNWMESTQCQQVKASSQTGCIVALRTA
jgi:hypothetical protein